MRDLQADQQVDVIGHAADAPRKSAAARNGPSQVLVHPRTPFRRDDGFAMLRRKHQMVMQAQIGGRHVAILQLTETLRPLTGSWGYGHREPVVSLRSTTG